MNSNKNSGFVQRPTPVPVQAARIEQLTIKAAKWSAVAALLAVVAAIFHLASVLLEKASHTVVTVNGPAIDAPAVPPARIAEPAPIKLPEVAPQPENVAEIPRVEQHEVPPNQVNETPSGPLYRVRVINDTLNLRNMPAATGLRQLVLTNNQPVTLDEIHGAWFVENWEGTEPCAWVRVIAESADGRVTGWCNAIYLQAEGRDPTIGPLASFKAKKDQREAERKAADAARQAQERQEAERTATMERRRAQEESELAQKRAAEMSERKQSEERIVVWSSQSGSGYYWRSWRGRSRSIRY